MDPPLHPPTRFQPYAVAAISGRKVQRALAIQVNDLQARGTPGQGVNTTVLVQLQKLQAALKEEEELIAKEK